MSDAKKELEVVDMSVYWIWGKASPFWKSYHASFMLDVGDL